MIRLTTPLKKEDLAKLSAGDEVLLSGTIYTARDAAHKRMLEDLAAGRSLPFDPKGQLIYYVGPTPGRPDQVLGSAGPTTSYRMDDLTLPLLQEGLLATIGKGRRSPAVKSALVQFGAVYFIASGGLGALIAKSILSSKVIAYEELGPEAIRKLEVVDLPVFVGIDVRGRDLYEEGYKAYEVKKEQV